MAIPITSIPVLKGTDAERFEQEMMDIKFDRNEARRARRMIELIRSKK